MRREALLLCMAVSLLAAGCNRLERLSIVKPTAERGDWTQVAPDYEVSDKGRTAAPMAAAQLLASAGAAYRAGKMEQAAQQAQAALKADPAMADAHTLLAAIAIENSDQEAAGRHYQQALAIAPGKGAYANNYGTWLCSNARAAALANAGTCAHRTGQLGRAEAYWRQALALEPTEMQSLAGMANLEFARARYLEARAFAERWLGIAPSDREALQLASQIELKLGDTDASTRYLQRLQALSPGAINAPRSQ